jgi:hypothetical protein
MTKAAASIAATFGRERKSLRSAAKKLADVENSPKTEKNKENSLTTVNRRTSRTPVPTQREPITQLQTRSPVKKGRVSSASSRGQTEKSPVKVLAQVSLLLNLYFIAMTLRLNKLVLVEFSA